jgi:hypothetical protein
MAAVIACIGSADSEIAHAIREAVGTTRDVPANATGPAASAIGGEPGDLTQFRG